MLDIDIKKRVNPFNPNKHGPFWHLNHPGCCAYHAAHPVVPFSCTLLGRRSDKEALC